MNDKFDELAKGLAQSVTRRGALKKFGVGIAGVVLAVLGLERKALAGKGGGGRVPNYCNVTRDAQNNLVENGYCLESHSKKYPYDCYYHWSTDCAAGRVPAAVFSDGEHCYQLHSETICR